MSNGRPQVVDEEERRRRIHEGSRLQDLRIKAGLDQEQAAQYIGVKANQISRKERGKAPFTQSERLALEILYTRPIAPESPSSTKMPPTDAMTAGAGGNDAKKDGFYEGVLWSCERMSAQLTEILRDARLGLRGGDSATAAPASRSLTEVETIERAARAVAEAASAPKEQERKSPRRRAAGEG